MTRPRIGIVVLQRHPGSEPGTASDTLLGPCEVAALRAAVALAGACAEAEVMLTAVAVGELERESVVLSRALGAGCHRAVCVTPNRPGESLGELDYLGTATVLASAIRHIGCDVLISGERSLGEQHAAVGPALAELLGIAHVSGVVEVSAGDTPRSLTAWHRAGARLHKVRFSMPVALFMLARSGQGPELADAPAAGEAAADRRARLDNIERLDPGELGVDVQALGRYARPGGGPIRPAQSGSRAVILDSADTLLSRLVDDRLVR